MIVPLVWWQSRYDGCAHAFPVGQATQENQPCYRALCQHIVTSRTVVRRRVGTSCVSCVLKAEGQLALDRERG